MSPRPSPSRAEAGGDEEGRAAGAAGGLSLWGGVWRSLVVVAVVVIFVYAYRESGLWDDPESLREAGGPRAAVVIFLIMACAWALGLPASALLLITPLLFPVHLSVPIVMAGCTAGAGAGYYVARFVGGWWVERGRGGRLRQFLSRHSSFLVIAALRLTPGVPHGFVNYAAGLASVPPARFLLATAAAMGVKSYVYAVAVSGAVEANSLAGAVNARTILSLLGLAALSVAGHVVVKLREGHGGPAPAGRGGEGAAGQGAGGAAGGDARG